MKYLYQVYDFSQESEFQAGGYKIVSRVESNGFVKSRRELRLDRNNDWFDFSACLRRKVQSCSGHKIRVSRLETNGFVEKLSRIATEPADLGLHALLYYSATLLL